MNKQFLLLLDGMTGAGKTTTSRILAQKIPRVAIIGMDKVKSFVSDFERGDRDNLIARNIIFEMTKEYFRQGLSVMVEQPFKTKEEIEKYENLTSDLNIPIYKFQLYVSPEIAYERINIRQKDSDNKIPDERIKRNISIFENHESLGFKLIDTSSAESELVAEDIFKVLK